MDTIARAVWNSYDEQLDSFPSEPKGWLVGVMTHSLRTKALSPKNEVWTFDPITARSLTLRFALCRSWSRMVACLSTGSPQARIRSWIPTTRCRMLFSVASHMLSLVSPHTSRHFKFLKDKIQDWLSNFQISKTQYFVWHAFSFFFPLTLKMGRNRSNLSSIQVLYQKEI